MVIRVGADESRRQLLRDAALTVVTALLAFAAFDDITTGRAATFIPEWVALAVCGGVLMIESWRLIQRGHQWLGSISAIALLAAFIAGPTIRSGISPFQIEYLTTVAALLWFLGLSGILLGLAWRRVDRSAA